MPIQPFMRVLMLMVFFACAAQTPTQSYGAEPVKIGVLAFRPKPQTLAQWQPLAVALKQALPERDFVVEALTYPELEQAVAARQLDFVLTNPGHFVFLTKRSGLSSPLATVAVKEHGRPATVYGGVIFTRAGQTDINTLLDIKGKTVATPTIEALAGYQMQAYELKRAGLRLPQDIKLLTTGMPHDKVVETVLAGHAEVGFVRSGVLEALEGEGKLDMKQLKILNRQTLPGFPQQVSTQLYPEWPFAAMPHIEETLARRVAAALFLLEDNKAATQAMGISGFVVPADYSPVEDVLRELRLPPFEIMPSFTLQDIWTRYRWQMAGSSLAFGVIVILGVVLLLMYRRLAAKHQLILLQQHNLQENEEKFRTVADYTLGWEYWEGVQHEILYISPSCESITGYSRAEFIASPDLLMRVVHPDDRQQAEAHRHDIGNQEDAILDFRIVRRDGGIRWIEHVCHPIWHDGVFKGRRISNRDISERKQAEKKLRESEEKYRLLFDSAGDAIFIHDEEARMLEVNQRAAEQYGYTIEELMALTIDQVDTPEESQYAPQRIARLMQHGHLTFETVHQRKDGSPLPTEVNARRINWHGKPAMMSICRDITERKRLEAEFVKIRNLESLAILTGGIAHDFNNLFQVLVGNIQLAKMNTEESSAAFPFLAQAEQTSALATKLTSQLSGFSSGGNMLPIIIQPASFIKEETFSAVAGSGLVAEFDLADTLWAIKVEPAQFANVIKQLVLNAREATDAGSGGKLRIKAVNESLRENQGSPSILDPGNYVKISFEDQGCGINEENLPHIFDPYFSTKQRGAQKGMGLGLTLCDTIIRKHGGAITVESELGKGTTFHVYLPAA